MNAIFNPAEKPHQFFVMWRNKKGQLKQFNTDNGEGALWAATRRNGTVYIDTRYAAKLRLYNYILNKQIAN